MAKRPSRRGVSGWERLGHPPGGPDMLGQPSRRAGSGHKAHPKGRSGRKALLELREWSAAPPGGPGVVGRTFRRTRIGPEAFPEGREWSGGPPGGQ